jgi:hypothetical protein
MKIKLGVIGLLMILCLAFPLSAVANASEPPIIIILIPEVGLDVEATLESEEVVLYGEVREKKIETYVRFYRYDIEENKALSKNVVFVFDTNKGEVIVEYQLENLNYNQLYTLDIENQTLKEGKSLSRDLTLIGMRFTLTLLIEGLVFFLMGYRQARTWILFLIVNLLTQGSLNYSITMSWTDNAYVILGFVVIEFFIIVAEWIVLLLTVKEGKKLKLWLTITLANILSLFLGGYLILSFPL